MRFSLELLLQRALGRAAEQVLHFRDGDRRTDREASDHFVRPLVQLGVVDDPVRDAEAFGVKPEEIAKTLSLRVGERSILVVTKGTARLDNKKAKTAFGGKPRMLSAEEVIDVTGHPVGGVCPFGLNTPLKVYCDVSLQAFDEVVPAAGSINSAVRISPQRLAALVEAEWVDVCQSQE